MAFIDLMIRTISKAALWSTHWIMADELLVCYVNGFGWSFSQSSLLNLCILETRTGPAKINQKLVLRVCPGMKCLVSPRAGGAKLPLACWHQYYSRDERGPRRWRYHGICSGWLCSACTRCLWYIGCCQPDTWKCLVCLLGLIPHTFSLSYYHHVIWHILFLNRAVVNVT